MAQLLPDGLAEERLAHAAAQQQFWRAMSAQIQRDRRNLRFVLPCTAALAAVVGVAARAGAWGGAAAVLGVSIWLMGQYFVRVRAHEYAYNLAEADRELERVQAERAASAGPANGPPASPRP